MRWDGRIWSSNSHFKLLELSVKMELVEKANDIRKKEKKKYKYSILELR